MSTEACYEYIKSQGGFQMPSERELKRSLRKAKKLNEMICRLKGDVGKKNFSTR